MAIQSFKSKKLKAFWEENDDSKIARDHIVTVTDILTQISASHHPRDLKKIFLSDFAQKKGGAAGVYSIKVNGNWRITFQIGDQGAIVLDYLDYHGKQIKRIK